MRLAEFSGVDRYRERAALAFSSFSDTLEERPSALSEMLLALDYQLDSTLEVVLVSPAQGGEPNAMLAPLRGTFGPSRILAVVREGSDHDELAKLVPLVSGKTARGGKTTAYVCENRICQFPTSDPQVFAQQLRSFNKID